MKWKHAVGVCNRDTKDYSWGQNTIYISEYVPVETEVGNSCYRIFSFPQQSSSFGGWNGVIFLLCWSVTRGVVFSE